MLCSQNRAPNIKLLKFHEIRDNQTYLEKVIFYGDLFDKFETAIGFMASKWVQGWSWISISSPGWPSMQNETTLIDIFSSKSVIFKTLLNIGNIYHFEAFFAMINNLESLPSNSPPFGLDRALKARIARKMKNFSGNFQWSIWVWMERWAHVQLIGGRISEIQWLDRQKNTRNCCGSPWLTRHHHCASDGAETGQRSSTEARTSWAGACPSTSSRRHRS